MIRKLTKLGLGPLLGKGIAKAGSIADQCIPKIEYSNHMKEYYWVREWVLNTAFPSSKIQLKDNLPNGQYWGVFNGIPFVATKSRIVEGWHSSDYITIRFLTTNFNVVDDLNQYVKENFSSDDSRFSISLASEDGWDFAGWFKKRPKESLFLSNDIHSSLFKDIEKFLSREDWYIETGIPFRRGYLLTGPPGTGKSSVAKVIAGEYNLPLYVLGINSKTIKDAELLKLSTSMGEGVLLIEDIDTLFDETPDEKDTLTKSALLNFLDGALSSDKRILIITCNDVSKVDYVLSRPGRVDKVIEFSYLDPITGQNLVDKLMGGLEDTNLKNRVFAIFDSNSNLTPAEIQEFCIENLEIEKDQFVKLMEEKWLRKEP